MPAIRLESLLKSRPPDTVLLIQMAKTVYEVVEVEQENVSVRLARDFRLDPNGTILEVEYPEIVNYWFLKI